MTAEVARHPVVADAGCQRRDVEGAQPVIAGAVGEAEGKIRKMHCRYSSWGWICVQPSLSHSTISKKYIRLWFRFAAAEKSSIF